MKASRAQRKQLARENAKQPMTLALVPKADWPPTSGAPNTLLRVWRSRRFLVQEYVADAPAIVRLSVMRTLYTGSGFADGIGWEELQELKRQCGYGDRTAVEVYPPDEDVVNIAAMRHVFVLDEPLAFAWKKGGRQ